MVLPLYEISSPDMEDKYMNAERMVARYHQFCQTHEFLGEAFPNLSADFGPGSLASYLGCDIGFNEDTTWFVPCLEDWDVIYDKATAAGKSLWVKVYSGGLDDWIRNCERLVMKYGSHSLFFLFPEMSHEMGTKLLNYAEEHWKDIKGSYVESLGR